MARKLSSFVDVDGVWYGPDDKVPAAVAKRITNPKAWAEDDTSEEPTPEAVEAARVRHSALTRPGGRDSGEAPPVARFAAVRIATRLLEQTASLLGVAFNPRS